MHDLAKIFIRCLNHWKLETPTARKQRISDDELQKYKANYTRYHCVKNVQMRTFSGPYFPVFGLNTEIYSVNLRIQSKYRKIRTRKTPHLDDFYALHVKQKSMERQRCLFLSESYPNFASNIKRIQGN